MTVQPGKETIVNKITGAWGRLPRWRILWAVWVAGCLAAGIARHGLAHTGVTLAWWLAGYVAGIPLALAGLWLYRKITVWRILRKYPHLRYLYEIQRTFGQ
jgi:hypothetical protein